MSIFIGTGFRYIKKNEQKVNHSIKGKVLKLMEIPTY